MLLLFVPGLIGLEIHLPYPHSCSVNDYVLTVSNSCFKSVHMEKAAESCPQGILGRDIAKRRLVCAKLISLTDEALQSIEKTVHIASEKNKVDLTHTIEMGENVVTQTWKKYDCYSLTTTDKSHLCNGNLLNDIHMGATQELIKTQFPNIHGLQNIQNSKYMKVFDSDENIQIVHVQLGKVDHWLTIST